MTMLKTVKAVLALATIGTMLLTGGCARTIHAHNAAGTTSLGAVPLTRSADFSYLGLTLDPPGAQAQDATITPDKALAGCSQSGILCPTSVKPTLFLALATSDNFGSLNGDGVDRLVYALLWTGFQCKASGGPSGGKPPTMQNCMAIDLVDAKTGADLGLIQTNDTSSIATATATG